MRFYVFFLLVIAGLSLPWSSYACSVSWQQDSVDVPVYYDRIGEGRYRFYYDDRYYLMDKSCGFVATIREAGFDPASQLFEGPFADYNLSGLKILTGSYSNGLRTGLFQAFHTNGKVKWEATFMDGQPVGAWQYYYPDGKPMLVLDYTERGMEIRDFWDLKGRQRVKNGKGRYEMRIETDGYNEFGAVYILRRGRLVNGKPNGSWPLEFIYADQGRMYIANDRYLNGHLDKEYARELDSYIRGTDRFNLVPAAWFLRAEEFTAKNCTIDDYSGFTGYLTWSLTDALKSIRGGEITESQAVFAVSVDKNGKATNIQAIEGPADKQTAQVLLTTLQAIEFWYPSFLDGEYIDDELKVRFDIAHSPLTGSLLVYATDIQREKGL